MKTENIKLYSRNAKKHPDEQLKMIARSLKEYGWRQPIVVDKDNTIIVGHGRYLAYQKYPEGIKEPWIVKADDLTPEQVRGYRLMDNKSNESDWDMALAIEELKDLDKLGFDISLTGFDRDLLVEPDEKDDILPTDAPTRAQFGDLWALGEHRVLCGDSTDKEAVARLMGDKKADMVMSDPPYNVEYTGGSTNEKDRKDSYKDKWTDGQYVEFLRSIYQNASDNSKGEAAFMIWFASAKMRQIMDGFEQAGWVARTLIVWNKLKAHYGALGAQYKHRMEPLWYCHKKGKSPKWYGATNETTVWDYDQPRVNDLHPTMKPVEIYVRCLKNHTKEDDIVYETFLGSGTTLIAAEKTGRICYGMEIDPKYCDVIIKRWEDYTGKRAVKIK